MVKEISIAERELVLYVAGGLIILWIGVVEVVVVALVLADATLIAVVDVEVVVADCCCCCWGVG